MNEVHLAFKSISVERNISVVCVRCGALICDWRRDGGIFVTTRPNQDKHLAWHESLEGK